MPRQPRKSIQTSFCHIIVQGIEREYIFKNNKLKIIYRNLLRKNLKNSNINVLAYCIMSNHAHILIHFDSIKQVSKLMQKTNGSFAKYYNAIKNRVGYVFRDRFYTQPIKNHNHLYNCIVYIHNNPVKANIIKSMSDYLYSSYREFERDKRILISDESLKIIFGSNTEFINTFNKIHCKREPKNIMDIKDRVKDYAKIIEDYSLCLNKSLNDIIKDEDDFRNLLLILRHECNLSLRKMENIFKINKNRLNKLINEVF